MSNLLVNKEGKILANSNGSVYTIPKSSGGFGGAVVIVDELPENPEEGVIYQVDRYTDANVFVHESSNNSAMALLEVIQNMVSIDAVVHYYVVDGLPNDANSSDITTFLEYHVYINTQDDIAYSYIDIGYGLMWVDVATIINTLFGTEYTNKGYIQHREVFISLLDNNFIDYSKEYGVYVTYKKQIGIKRERTNVLSYKENWIDYESIFNKTVTKFVDNKILCLGTYTFAGCKQLTTVKCENLEQILSYAFFKCEKIEEINIPNAKDIGANAFSYCTDLKRIEMPNVHNLSSQSFAYCINIEEIHAPFLYTIGARCFTNCGSLKKVYAPRLILETQDKDVFSYCTDLTEVYMPNTSMVPEDCFVYCTSLQEIDLTATDIEKSAFSYCTSLKTVYLRGPLNPEDSVVEEIGIYAFNFCENLSDIYLGTIDTFSVSSDSFKGAGSTQGYINIHVRPELVSAYEEATNWAALIAEGKIKIIGDYTDD